MVQVPGHRPIGRPVSPLLKQPQKHSRDDFTFASNSEQHINGDEVPRSTTFSLGLNPDAALPSIETPPAGRETSHTLRSSPLSPRLPSLTLTPSDPACDHTPTQATADGQRDIASNDLDTRLEGFRLSTAEPVMMDMAAISAALSDVASGQSRASTPQLITTLQCSDSPGPGRRARRSLLRSQNSRNTPKKYVVEDEAPFDDKFNCPAVQNSLRDTKKLMTELADVLGSSAVHEEPDSVMQRLHRQAQDLVNFERPSTRTVGFVGDSGTGKSSLINSLLDSSDLAGSSGEGACTCVATEFHFHADKKLAMTVERFTEEELMLQLESLLQDYRAFYLNDDRDPPGSHGAVDAEERVKLAKDTFQAMFHGSFVHKGTLIEGTEQMAVSTLKSWMRDFGGAAAVERHLGLSRDECSSLLVKFASGISKEGAAAYPWIKKIKVYLNAHILRNGLVLVDLPGLHDLNAARRNITERYILECDRIFIVANIDRATTNQGIPAIFQLAQKARLSNIGIVCTKIDDIEATYLLKKYKGHKIARVIQNHLDEIETENSEIKRLQQEISGFEDDVDDVDDLDEEEKQELNRLNKKQRSTMKRLSDREFDLTSYLVATRNENVKKTLLAAYKDIIPQEELKVFCTSSKLYWEGRDKSFDSALRYLQLSGILSLREHCMAMVSESQYRAAEKYMRDDVGTLLGELSLWLQAGLGSLSAERKENTRLALNTLEKELQQALCGRRSVLNGVANFYQAGFRTIVYNSQADNLHRWRAAAMEASEEWSLWSHQTYAAFCRNYGTHATAAVGFKCWNEEIIEEMVHDLAPPWDELQCRLDDHDDELADSIDNIFGRVDELLDSQLGDSQDTASHLSSALLSKRYVLRAEVATILRELQQSGLRTLRIDAMSGVNSSLIGQAMQEAYRRAARESGTGSHARRKKIITSAVSQARLFDNLLWDFKTKFNSLAEETQSQIREVVNTHLREIKNTLDIVRSENAAFECEKDAEFKRRVESRLQATRAEMDRLYGIMGI